jgi:hypothetical protein
VLSEEGFSEHVGQLLELPGISVDNPSHGASEKLHGFFREHRLKHPQDIAL